MVDALPISKEPPCTLYPKYAEILVIINAKVNALMMPNTILKVRKSLINP